MFNQHKIYRVLQLITQLQNKPSKSVRFMATFLECTERTSYRYIDLLKQLGFDVQKDEHNKFFIVRENQTEEHFTSEEATFLVEMVKTVGKENMLKDSILKKIYLKSNISQQANALFKAHLSKLVENPLKSIFDYDGINVYYSEDNLLEFFVLRCLIRIIRELLFN